MSRAPAGRPPEAQLIYDARMALGLSFRQAAAAASRYGKMSEGSWRRTESARRLTRTPQTLARMAAAVRVGPAQMEQAHRPDAAAELARILAADDAAQDRRGARATPEALRAMAADLLAAADELDGGAEENGDRRRA